MKKRYQWLFLGLVSIFGCHRDPYPGFTRIGSASNFTLYVDEKTLVRPATDALVGYATLDFTDGTHAVGSFFLQCRTGALSFDESSVFSRDGAFLRISKKQDIHDSAIRDSLCVLQSKVAQTPLFDGTYDVAVAAIKLTGPNGIWDVDPSNSLLKGAAWGNGTKFKAHVLLDAEVSDSGSAGRLLILGSVPLTDNSCHACGVLLSAYVLHHVGTGWFLDAGNGYLTIAGSFGRPPNLQLIQVGPQKFGFIISDSYMAQGQGGETSTLYILAGKVFHKVLTLQTATDDGGMFGSQLSQKTSFTIGPETVHDLFVIHLHTSGTDTDGHQVSSEASCTFQDTEYKCPNLAN